MAFGHLQDLFCGAGWFAAVLLPLLQGALRYTQRCGKLCLRESALHPHTNDGQFGFNALPLSVSSVDLPYTVKDFLPHIAFGFEGGEVPYRLVFYLSRNVSSGLRLLLTVRRLAQ